MRQCAVSVTQNTSLDKFTSKPYIKSEIKTKIENELKRYNNGQGITEEIFRSATGGSENIRRDSTGSVPERRGETENQIGE